MNDDLIKNDYIEAIKLFDSGSYKTAIEKLESLPKDSRYYLNYQKTKYKYFDNIYLEIKKKLKRKDSDELKKYLDIASILNHKSIEKLKDEYFEIIYQQIRDKLTNFELKKMSFYFEIAHIIVSKKNKKRMKKIERDYRRLLRKDWKTLYKIKQKKEKLRKKAIRYTEKAKSFSTKITDESKLYFALVAIRADKNYAPAYYYAAIKFMKLKSKKRARIYFKRYLKFKNIKMRELARNQLIKLSR